MTERSSEQPNAPTPEEAILPPTDMFVVAAIAGERRRNPADFTERSLIHIRKADPELARQIQAEAKRLGTSDLSKEEVASQIATWIYEIINAQAVVNRMEEQFRSQEFTDESTSPPVVEFREPPAA